MGQEDVDFDYPFSNLPSALVEPLPPVFLLYLTSTFPSVVGRRACRYVSETTVVTLETNYRSTQSILDVTNRIIDLTPKPHAKELRSVKGTRP